MKTKKFIVESLDRKGTEMQKVSDFICSIDLKKFYDVQIEVIDQIKPIVEISVMYRS